MTWRLLVDGLLTGCWRVVGEARVGGEGRGRRGEREEREVIVSTQ